MAEMHGIAGEWARVKGAILGLWPLALGIFMAGFSIALWFVAGIMLASILLVASIIAIGVALVAGFRRVESFYVGARGEERVAGILASLPDSCHVFNDFLASGVHVDHVVASPQGVFAIETKFWRGKVTVEEGHILVEGRLPSRDPLAQVLREATLVKSALLKTGWQGQVTPLLAFASDTFAPGSAELHGAIVVNSRDLSSFFADRREILSPDELSRTVSLMRTM